MVKSTEPKEELDVGSAEEVMETNGCASTKGKQDLSVEPIMVIVADAKASTTEEPREGKLHAGICAGDVEQSAFLP
jgi:hypothetical protein